jgi:hypothetical protein
MPIFLLSTWEKRPITKTINDGTTAPPSLAPSSHMTHGNNNPVTAHGLDSTERERMTGITKTNNDGTTAPPSLAPSSHMTHGNNNHIPAHGLDSTERARMTGRFSCCPRGKKGVSQNNQTTAPTSLAPSVTWHTAIAIQLLLMA